MSLKQNAYAVANPAPKLSSRFSIMLPKCPWSVLRVSSSSLPLPSYATSQLSWSGKDIMLPTKKITHGTFTCTYDEDTFLSGMLTISHLERALNTASLEDRDLLIFLTDDFTGEVPQNCTTLKGVFLTSVTPLQLSWSESSPVKWTLTFTYNDIEPWF